MTARAQDNWTPQYPAFARNPDGLTGDAIADPDAQTGGGDIPWTLAPGDSHLWGFRFADARTSPFQRKFLGGKSYLYVRFKPSGKTPGYSEYEYEFADPAEGRRVFEAMAGSAHPGEVVHQELIRKGVPYRPTHK